MTSVKSKLKQFEPEPEIPKLSNSKSITQSKESSSVFESKNIVHFDKQKKIYSSVKPRQNRNFNKFQLISTRFVLFVKKSRWSGIPLAAFYGIYVYYMLTFLILPNSGSFKHQDLKTNHSNE
jgi:hypothetical protein